MSELEVITTIEQPTVQVKITAGEFTIKPLTVKRLAKLAVLVKDLRGDVKQLEDPDSPDFRNAISNMLISAGDSLPKALAIISDDPKLEKLEDISLLDLGTVVLAAARANKANKLKEVFLKAKEEINPEAK